MTVATHYRSKVEMAENLGCSVATVQMYLHVLGLKPAKRERREFQTRRGRRVGIVALYSEGTFQKLKEARRGHEEPRR